MLVGGSSKLPGIAEFTKEKLELPARLGSLQPLSGLIDTVEDPMYCTAVGLMLLDMLLLPGEGMQPGEPVSGAFGLIEGLLGKMGFKK